jgi:PglZ domain
VTIQPEKSVLASIRDSLDAVSLVNQSIQLRPMVILWTDAESVWLPSISALRAAIPRLLTLGELDTSTLTGPAIWIKCAIAGVLPEVTFGDGTPIIYLPGVSRADLRAIESCARDLQPLAELQYRGVFWSQANGKDWTLNAFLSSKNGGLSIDVGKDQNTQDSLSRALVAGVILERSVAELKSRQINASWLDSLLAPNPARDVLEWMNAPTQVQTKWQGARWDLFLKRCKSDFCFDPLADGDLAAAEKLTLAERDKTNQWGAVWELYSDSFSSFPEVVNLMLKVAPPKGSLQADLFKDWSSFGGYPQANENGEAAIRFQLLQCAAMDVSVAYKTIFQLEEEQGCRRNWLWAKMGQSPLVNALGSLAMLCKLASRVVVGKTIVELRADYQEIGWKIDNAALLAMSQVKAKTDIEAVNAALRSVYLPWLDALAIRFQDALKGEGRLGTQPTVADFDALPERVCVVFVDGLRYDVAEMLTMRLAHLGRTTLTANWTTMPSVTASGKAWCSPVAHLITGTKADSDFEPRIAADSKPASSQNLKKLLLDSGVVPLDKDDTGDPTIRAWVECGNLDHYGHEHGTRLARDMDSQLNQIVERISELRDAGWRNFRIVTDHGWLLMPGGLPKTELPKHQVETRWGRCAVLKDSSHGTPLTFGWDWCSDVQVAYAPGIANFRAGVEYTHGGLTLQECLVPVLSLNVNGATDRPAAPTIENVQWRGLRCDVQINSTDASFFLDMRSKPILANSSLVSNVKQFSAGKASVAVADDDQLGVAAFIVVLDENMQVVQKTVITVGG